MAYLGLEQDVTALNHSLGQDSAGHLRLVLAPELEGVTSPKVNTNRDL